MQATTSAAASEQTALLQPKTHDSNNSSSSQEAACSPTLGAQAWTLGSTLARAIWESGGWCMSIASLVFSISGLLVKLVHVPTFEIVVVRSSLSFAACAFGAHKARIKPLFGQRRNLLALLGRGCFGAAAMSTYYMSIAALPLADAVTLFFMNPAVTALAAWLILKEPLGLIGVGGIGMSLVGLVLQTQPPIIFHANSQAWDHTRSVGTSFGLLSAMCAAGAFICIRFIGKGEPALVMSVYFHTCAFVSSALPLAAGVPDKAVLPSWRDAGLLLGIAGTSFWGQILIGRSFQLLSAAKASAINFSQVIYSYIFGIVLLGESISLWGVAGSLLIAGGVLLVNLRPQLPAPTTHQPGSDAISKAPPAGGVQPCDPRDSVRDWVGDGKAGPGQSKQEAQPLLLAAESGRSHSAPGTVQLKPALELQPLTHDMVVLQLDAAEHGALDAADSVNTQPGGVPAQPHPFLHADLASQPSHAQPALTGSECMSPVGRRVHWSSDAGACESPGPWRAMARVLGHMDSRVRLPAHDSQGTAPGRQS